VTDLLPSAKDRVRIIKQTFQRPVAGPSQVYQMIRKSIAVKRGISVIRLGDVMAKLLSKRDLLTLQEVSRFIGIPFPPPRRLHADIRDAVINANIVGVTHFPKRSRQIKYFMKRNRWSPPHLTDAFINDQLYDYGYLHRLIANYRVVLIGRSAEKAAYRLKKQGYNVALTYNLDHYGKLSQIYQALKKSSGKWDLALIGASVPGRILTVKVAQDLNKTAVEIGHMMDSLADPGDWAKYHDRKRYKLRWIRRLT
jgi:hypothetical protein